ncbi:MAG: hypothetical protein IPO22_17560 [Anaerolineales bacterium]|nr:hypothetical protein [Anaerolineales bacterium]
MTISSRYKDLFRAASIVEKLSLFQQLLEGSELYVDLALALLKAIHKQLSVDTARDHLDYKRYAETIELLRYHRADMLKEVIDAWKAENPSEEVEWLSDGVIK